MASPLDLATGRPGTVARATAPTYATGSVRSTDGTTIGYRRVGTGPGVVVVHGAMGSAQSHVQLAEALADSFTVYLIVAPRLLLIAWNTTCTATRRRRLPGQAGTRCRENSGTVRARSRGSPGPAGPGPRAPR
jgi:pimeloyl-ACP methyl ester carboxylesterase